MKEIKEINILNEFRNFGERFFIIGILMVLSIFVDFLRFFAFIVLILALGNIKKINIVLNDKNLDKFQSKIKNSIIIGIIAGAILGVAAGIAVYQYMIGVDWIYYLLPINIAIWGIIVLIKSILVQKKAWHKLNKFFLKNANLFPDEIVNEALDGTDKLEKSCKYTLYIITIPIAIIYGIIGLFKLAKLRNIPIYTDKKTHTPTKYKDPSSIEPKQDSQQVNSYCISCGNKLERHGRFCALCGFDMGTSKAQI